MTDPLQGREDQLPVRHRHVVLGQDDAEEEEESLAVSGGQDGGGGEEGAATERPAGEFVGEPHLTVQELIIVSRRAERGELTCQGNWCLVAGSPPTIRILSRGTMEVPQLQLGVAGAGEGSEGLGGRTGGGLITTPQPRHLPSRAVINQPSR